MNRFRAVVALTSLLFAAPLAASAAGSSAAAPHAPSVARAKGDHPHCITERLPLDRRHRSCSGRSGRWW